MPELLFLAHRIPYPPDKGDKIRSWHVLRHLAERYRVHLGCLIDDPQDWAHVPFLKTVCASTQFASLRPLAARLRSLRGLLTGSALTFPYFRDRSLAGWVRQKLRERRIEVQFIYSSAMAPYVEGVTDASGFRVVDFGDVDSDKWSQYAKSKPQPARWVYAREARLLARAEREICAASAASLFVSEPEADFFRAQPGVDAARVHALSNGVDLEFFSPETAHADPYPPGGPVLVFTGAMDYWANVDAVTWFRDEVLPLIRKEVPEVRLAIVGARPTAAVQRLGAEPGVLVTGRVEDVRPWVAHAAVSVAPLRIARGIQNKVLEAMAMGMPVVASPQAFEGIDADPEADLAVAEGAERFAQATLALLHQAEKRENLGRRARACMTSRYSWESRLSSLDEILPGPRRSNLKEM